MDLCSPKRYNTNRFFIVRMPHYSRILSPSSWQLCWLSRKLNFSSGFRSVASSVALHWSKYSGNIVDNVYDTLCLLYENGSTGAECRLVVRSIAWSTQAYIFQLGYFRTLNRTYFRCSLQKLEIWSSSWLLLLLLGRIACTECKDAASCCRSLSLV